MNNDIELKLVDQNFDGVEGWIRNKNSSWVRLDFMLEYFLSSNVTISRRYKGKLESRERSIQYYEELLSKFKEQTQNGKSFNFQEYKEWLKNRAELEKVRKLLG